MNNQCLFEKYFFEHLHETNSVASANMGPAGPVAGSIGPYKSVYAGDDARTPTVIGAKKKGKKQTFPIIKREPIETIFLTGK